MTFTKSEAQEIIKKILGDTLPSSKVEIVPDPGMPNCVMVDTNTLEQAITELCRADNLSNSTSTKILAIRLWRQLKPGTGLAEAKTEVERIIASFP